MTCTGNIPPLCSVDSQIFHPWPIWSGHSKHSRAEEQPSCWLEVSRKGNPSIFSVGYCQLINREIGASSSLNTLSTHSTHFLAAENTIFIYTILSQYKLFYGFWLSQPATQNEWSLCLPCLLWERLLLLLPRRVPLTGSALGWATAIGEVLVIVVMVAAGSIRVDMSTQLRIDLKIVYGVGLSWTKTW